VAAVRVAVQAAVRAAAVVRVPAVVRAAEWGLELGRALALVRPALAARGPDLLREAPEAGMAAAW